MGNDVFSMLVMQAKGRELIQHLVIQEYTLVSKLDGCNIHQSFSLSSVCFLLLQLGQVKLLLASKKVSKVGNHSQGLPFQ